MEFCHVRKQTGHFLLSNIKQRHYIFLQKYVASFQVLVLSGIAFWYTWRESENKQRIFCLKIYFTLPEALQFRVWHISVLFTRKMLSSSILLVCLIPDVTSLKLHFNWLFNIYLSPGQKRNCQKCRYLNSKYSIKINAVWQSSEDTFSKQQKPYFPHEANPTWFFHVCFIK